MSVFIELKNVGVKLGGQPILRDINLKLLPGEITAITGPSGSGLSVLLKTAAGLIPATSGQVLYDGRNLDSFSDQERRELQTRTGFVFQDAALWANMTVQANLDLPLQAKFPDMNKEERFKKIEASLQQYGFRVDTQKRPVDFSQGQKKFVSFLRAVIPGPEALFLDEPTAWLDRPWADKILDELSALRTRETAIALASNQYESTFDWADHVITLRRGQIVDNGTAE